MAALEHRFEQEEGRTVLTVELPGVASLDGLELDIGDAELRLAGDLGQAAPGTARIVLPSGLSSAEGSAKFSKRRRQLVVTWPSSASAGVVAPAAVAAEVEPAPCGVSADGSASHDAAPVAASPAASIDAAKEQLTTPDSAAAGRPAAAAQAVAPAASAPPSAGAYGSLWNANSWHWEERNCMDTVKSEVRAALARCEAAELKHVRQLAGACVSLKDVEVTGEAGISIRKGKRILCFEVSVSFRFECRDEFGGPMGVKGTGKASGITQEEGEDAPSVHIEVSALSSGGREAKAAGEWMRRQGAAAIGAALLGETLAAAVLAADAAQADPAADRRRREAERQRAEEARRATEAVREQIAVEQRAKETAGREAVTTAREAVAAASDVKGSVWNVNAWHWEEKPMNDFARAWLERELGGLRIDLLGGAAVAELSDVRVSGDASVSVRKGKPITLFLLQVECAWIARAQGLGEAEGTLRAPEFSSEDGADGSPLHTVARKDSSTGRLTMAFRKEGVARVRRVLGGFVDALRAQLQRPGPGAEGA